MTILTVSLGALGLFVAWMLRLHQVQSRQFPEIDTESVSPEYVREKLRWR